MKHRGFAATAVIDFLHSGDGSGLARLIAVAWLITAALACAEPPRCESGLCPSGTTCNSTTGLCEEVHGGLDPAQVGVLGSIASVSVPGLHAAFAGWSPARQSLVVFEHGIGWKVTFVAGPSASSGEGPAGESSAMAVDAVGTLHVAYTRQSDATLWHAVAKDGLWQRVRVDVAPAGAVGSNVALAVSPVGPVIAWQAAGGGVHLSRLSAAGQWTDEVVPAPSATAAGGLPALQLGDSLDMTVTPSGVVIATYDRVEGDLVLAARAGAGWSVSRLAGTNAVTGADTGDVGLPCALARGLGGELVVAYRDRTRNRVMIARSKSGVVEHEVVATGDYVVEGTGQVRRHLIGTALDVAVLPNGRVTVAYQDASRLRVVAAVEKPGGGYYRWDVPGGDEPQAWPTIASQIDGTARLGFVALAADRSPPSGRFASWMLQQEVAP